MRRSPNYDERRAEVDMLLLHYTGMADCAAALERLCDPQMKVSAHYLVEEDGTCQALVPEDKRAWHAGEGFWAGASDINSCSIGIELVNGGHDFDLPDFPEAQLAGLEALCSELVQKYKIPPHRVLGHSDIAPLRKQDPGEKFDWARLARQGIGLWLAPPPPDSAREDEVLAYEHLVRYGYDSKLSLEVLLKAFQRHYRPARVDGVLDGSTAAALDALAALAIP